MESQCSAAIAWSRRRQEARYNKIVAKNYVRRVCDWLMRVMVPAKRVILPSRVSVLPISNRQRHVKSTLFITNARLEVFVTYRPFKKLGASVCRSTVVSMVHPAGHGRHTDRRLRSYELHWVGRYQP
jgi:hypothetical protein